MIQSPACTPTIRNGKSSLYQEILFLNICLLVFYCGVICTAKRSFLYGDPLANFYVATSILEDGDMDLRNQFEFNPLKTGDQIAIGKNGEWYPLHEYMLSALSVPFLAVFGKNGCLMLNLIIMACLTSAIYSICRTFVSPIIAYTTLMLTATNPLILSMAHSFSNDVIGALVLVLSYRFIMKAEYFLAGLTWGTLFFFRIQNLISLPAFLLAVIFVSRPAEGLHYIGEYFRSRVRESLKKLVFFGLGSSAMVFLALFANYKMFGDPMTMSYMWWGRTVGGVVQITPQQNLFTRPFLVGLYDLAFHPSMGLLTNAPTFTLALLLGLRPMWSRFRGHAIFFLTLLFSVVTLYSCYFASYSDGYAHERYLLYLLMLSAIPLALAVSDCYDSLPDWK